MQIFLHNLDGTQTIHHVDEHTTLQQLLTAATKLVYQGSILTSLDSLLDGANVYATGDLDGGKKKKKKKVYTTKKKNKHIHKTIKLLPLSLYSVDGTCCCNPGNGNVTQQRKTCPSCGPGTFMAQHWDRYYCGLCHTTIKMDAETVKKNEEKMRIKREAM